MAPAPIFRNCPVCGHSQTRPAMQKHELQLVRCRQCSMLYANPVAAEFASGKYYDRAGAEYYLSSAKLESDYADVRFERELRLFRRYCDSGAVLDVGCSSGAFLYQLNRRFPGHYQILGTDASSAPLDYAESRGVAVMHGNFPDLDFGGREFAAVTFWAVLEHLPDPKLFLNKAASLLRAGGYCFVLVPNLKSLAVRILGARYRYIYPEHLNYFARATLIQMAPAHLFTVVAVRSTHFNPIVIWEDWRGGAREVSREERAELLKRTTGYKQKRGFGLIRAMYQLTEKVLGVFNLADNLAVVLRKR